MTHEALWVMKTEGGYERRQGESLRGVTHL